MSSVKDCRQPPDIGKLRDMDLKEFKKGLVLSISVMTGYVPVAIAYAATALYTGLTPWQTIAMSLFVYTGAGQMAAVVMIGQGVSLTGITTAVFIMNLRHVIMSTVVMERMRQTPLGIRVLLSLGITDEVFALETADSSASGSSNAACFAGIALGAWGSWVLGTCLGCGISTMMPPKLMTALSISLYALFISILTPQIRRHLPLITVVLISAAISSLIGSSQGIIIGSLAGAAAGVFLVKEEDLP